MNTPRFVLAVLPALLLSLAACTTMPTPDPGPDPCLGNNPSAAASAWQGPPPYTGKDSFTNIVLRKGAVLYTLTPGGTPGFAVDDDTLAQAGGSVARYYELVQVSTDPGTDAHGKPRKLRENVRAYQANADLCVAFGKALANPQFGKGGGTQYYVVPADAGKLAPGAVRPI